MASPPSASMKALSSLLVSLKSDVLTSTRALMALMEHAAMTTKQISRKLAMEQAKQRNTYATTNGDSSVAAERDLLRQRAEDLEEQLDSERSAHEERVQATNRQCEAKIKAVRAECEERVKLAQQASTASSAEDKDAASAKAAVAAASREADVQRKRADALAAELAESRREAKVLLARSQQPASSSSAPAAGDAGAAEAIVAEMEAVVVRLSRQLSDKQMELDAAHAALRDNLQERRELANELMTMKSAAVATTGGGGAPTASATQRASAPKPHSTHVGIGRAKVRALPR